MMFNLPLALIYNYMKINVLSAIFSFLTLFTFTACIDSENSGNGNNDNTSPEIKTYELTVNDKTWTILPAKVILTDNAKKNPETYTHDYTLTIIAIDASNMVNQDSKRLDISFDAEDLNDLKNVNIAEDENFQILYRSAKDIKAIKYKTTDGIFTVSAIDKKTVSFAFNQLKLEGESGGLLLPGIENPTLSIKGEVKCSL